MLCIPYHTILYDTMLFYIILFNKADQNDKNPTSTFKKKGLCTQNMFSWSRTHSSNWRENCILEWEKNWEKYQKRTADHISTGWRWNVLLQKLVVNECSLVSRISSSNICLNHAPENFILFLWYCSLSPPRPNIFMSYALNFDTDRNASSEENWNFD